MTRGSWLAMLAVVVVVGAVRGWDCVCNPRECEVLEPSGCPGLGIVVWDPCSVGLRWIGPTDGEQPYSVVTFDYGNSICHVWAVLHRCCKVCARTLGEDCGGFSGTCEPGLKCVDGSCTPIT